VPSATRPYSRRPRRFELEICAEARNGDLDRFGCLVVDVHLVKVLGHLDRQAREPDPLFRACAGAPGPRRTGALRSRPGPRARRTDLPRLALASEPNRLLRQRRVWASTRVTWPYPPSSWPWTTRSCSPPTGVGPQVVEPSSLTPMSSRNGVISPKISTCGHRPNTSRRPGKLSSIDSGNQNRPFAWPPFSVSRGTAGPSFAIGSGPWAASGSHLVARAEVAFTPMPSTSCPVATQGVASLRPSRQARPSQ